MAQLLVPSFPLTANSPSQTLPGVVIMGSEAVANNSFISTTSQYITTTNKPFVAGQAVRLVSDSTDAYPVYDAIYMAGVTPTISYGRVDGIIVYDVRTQYFDNASNNAVGVLPATEGNSIWMFAGANITSGSAVSWNASLQAVVPGAVFDPDGTTSYIFGYAQTNATANSLVAIQLTSPTNTIFS